MKALITGVTGFAGQHLARHLLESWDEVLGCSRGGTWPTSAPQELVESLRLLPWDLREKPSNWFLTHVATFKPDVIYHLGAISVPGQCGSDEPTREAVAVNVVGSTSVCDLAGRIAAHPRIVLTSSRHVYGEVPKQSTPVKETYTTAPTTAYGKTKLAAEYAALQSVASSGIEVVIARAFSHTGPGQSPPLMLPQWCEQLAGGAEALRVRNPNVWVDVSDVRDVVRAYRQLALRGRSGQTYNVGSGVPVRTGEVARRLLDSAARGTSMQVESTEELRNPIADIRKLQCLTNWRPEIPLERTIADTWRYWVERSAAKS